MTFSELLDLATLPRIVSCAALRLLGHSTFTPEDEVPEPTLFGFRIFLLLQRISAFSADQRMLLFEQLAADLPSLKKSAETTGSAFIVADSRWVTWTGRIGWLDMETGDTVNTKLDVFVTVAYSLHRLLYPGAENAAQQPATERSADQP